MSRKYQIIQPPLPLKFREMSKAQANEYLLWFTDQIPIRIVELSSFVKSFPEYSNWDSDLQPSSLIPLGNWFFEQVQARNRSKADINNIYAEAEGWFRNNFEIPNWDLTDVTFSLAIDIGMYLGRIIEQNIPFLTWKLGAKPKNNINYQQPVLCGSGKVECNPVHLVTTLAYGIANQSKGPDRLKELYDVWFNLLDN